MSSFCEERKKDKIQFCQLLMLNWFQSDSKLKIWEENCCNVSQTLPKPKVILFLYSDVLSLESCYVCTFEYSWMSLQILIDKQCYLPGIFCCGNVIWHIMAGFDACKNTWTWRHPSIFHRFFVLRNLIGLLIWYSIAL